ncbi:MAG: hypothetical protein AAB777_02305 [Patescibacteria group bacterium]
MLQKTRATLRAKLVKLGTMLATMPPKRRAGVSPKIVMILTTVGPTAVANEPEGRGVLQRYSPFNYLCYYIQMKKNPVCTILWRDAAYTFEPEIPKELPKPRLTTGFIIKTNDEYTFIATNVSYDKKTGEMSPVDGFVIPEKAIIEFKKIGNYNE